MRLQARPAGWLILVVVANSLTACDGSRRAVPTGRANPPSPPANAVDSRKTETRKRLTQIATAIAASRRDNYPTVGYYDRKSTKPGLSWRVALLPELGREDLFKMFRLDEAWDSPHNKGLIEKMPEVFAPSQEKASIGATHYRAFAGDRAALPPPAREDHVRWLFSGKQFYRGKFYPVGGLATMLGRRVTDIVDGNGFTLFLAEAADPVPWTKPDELNYDPKKPLPRLVGVYDDGFFALSLMGSVVFVPADTEEKTIRALITFNGSERITDERLVKQLFPQGLSGYPKTTAKTGK